MSTLHFSDNSKALDLFLEAQKTYYEPMDQWNSDIKEIQRTLANCGIPVSEFKNTRITQANYADLFELSLEFRDYQGVSQFCVCQDIASSCNDNWSALLSGSLDLRMFVKKHDLVPKLLKRFAFLLVQDGDNSQDTIQREKEFFNDLPKFELKPGVYGIDIEGFRPIYGSRLAHVWVQQLKADNRSAQIIDITDPDSPFTHSDQEQIEHEITFRSSNKTIFVTKYCLPFLDKDKADDFIREHCDTFVSLKLIVDTTDKDQLDIPAHYKAL